jgi:hypothetical protein
MAVRANNTVKTGRTQTRLPALAARRVRWKTRRSAPGEEAFAAEPGFIGQIGNVDDLN